MKYSTLFSAFIISSAFLFSVLPQTAAAQEHPATHKVQPGETLFSISRKYNVTVEQLRNWNNLRGNTIDVGRELFVAEPDPQQNYILHKVDPQETLFSISKQYGVTISDIRTWNELESSTLNVDQELKIFLSTGSTSRESGQIVETTPASHNTYYTVKSGDTLYRIAREHNMPVDELRALNDLASDNISVGQRLTVRKTRTAPSVTEGSLESSPQGRFITWRLERDESLDNILKKFKMSRSEFDPLNPDLSGEQLQAGRRITVLAPPTRRFKNPYLTEGNLTDLGGTFVSTYPADAAGQTTTSGELYNPEQLTAAHSNISLGSIIFLRNPENNRGIYVRINDRISGGGIMLSHSAYNALGFAAGDSARVTIYQDQ